MRATGVGDFVCNLAFLGRVVAHPVFAEGRALTGFVETYRSDLAG